MTFCCIFFEKPDISPEDIQFLSDPIRVITEMARIKVESNRLQEIITNELIRRQSFRSNDLQTNEENNETNPISKALESNENIEPKVVKNVNIFQIRVNESNESNTNLATLSLFSVSESHESDPFGPQNTDKSEASGVEQNIGFSLFGNQSATTSSANRSTFSLFGHQSPPEEPNNGSGFGLKRLFKSGSDADTSSPNPSKDSFNFFK